MSGFSADATAPISPISTAARNLLLMSTVSDSVSTHLPLVTDRVRHEMHGGVRRLYTSRPQATSVRQMRCESCRGAAGDQSDGRIGQAQHWNQRRERLRLR